MSIYVHPAGHKSILKNRVCPTMDKGAYPVCYMNPGDPENIYRDGDLYQGVFLHVAWRPGTDAQASLDRHYQSKAVIDRNIAVAPEGDEEKALYFHDTVCAMMEYDHEGLNSGNAKYDACYGILEGTCVCQGYAQTFLNLAYYSGLSVAYLRIEDSEDDDETHAINEVRFGDLWYKYDCTWDDGNPVSRRYCKVLMNDQYQAELNSPAYYY